MKIIKYKKLPGNKYKITLDNNDIILYEDIIIKNMILLKNYQSPFLFLINRESMARSGKQFP